jgi:peptide/nickel transport system permease protein
MQALLYGEYTTLYPAIMIALIAVSMNIFVDWLLLQSSTKLPDEV